MWLKRSEYMYDETCTKVVKVVASGIRKIKFGNVACYFPMLFHVYLTSDICTSKLSTYYT